MVAFCAENDMFVVSGEFLSPLWAFIQSVTNCYIYTCDTRHNYVRWGLDHSVILCWFLCVSTVEMMVCSTEASSFSLWRNLEGEMQTITPNSLFTSRWGSLQWREGVAVHTVVFIYLANLQLADDLSNYSVIILHTWTDLWWWTVYVSLAVATWGTPWWSPPGTHLQTSCWTPENPRSTQRSSASCPLSSWLQASGCSYGKMLAHPGIWAPPTQSWIPLLAYRSENQSSSASLPPLHSCRTAAGSPAAADDGPQARRDSSAQAPPSNSRP